MAYEFLMLQRACNGGSATNGMMTVTHVDKMSVREGYEGKPTQEFESVITSPVAHENVEISRKFVYKRQKEVEKAVINRTTGKVRMNKKGEEVSKPHFEPYEECKYKHRDTAVHSEAPQYSVLYFSLMDLEKTLRFRRPQSSA